MSLKQAQALNAEGKTDLLDIHTNLEARQSNFDQAMVETGCGFLEFSSWT